MFVATKTPLRELPMLPVLRNDPRARILIIGGSPCLTPLTIRDGNRDGIRGLLLLLLGRQHPIDNREVIMIRVVMERLRLANHLEGLSMARLPLQTISQIP